MSVTLSISLNATDIKNAVKADTYITGLIDRSADMVKNASLAYNEQAGDEAYHNAKLNRTMLGAVSKLEAAMADFLESSDSSASITDNLTSASTTFAITINAPDRISIGYSTPITRLASEYIINTMLYYWWQPIKPSLAKDYLAFAADNAADIRRCLCKKAPAPSTATYPTITGTITPYNNDDSDDSDDSESSETP